MTAQSIPGFTTSDRFGVSFFGSFLIHLVVVLGVTFAAPKLRDLQGLPTLEITLVQTRSDKAPDTPEFLAQANQDGGGEGNTADIARSPLPVREISERRHEVPTAFSTPQPRVRSAREVTEILSQKSERITKPVDPEPQKQDLEMRPPNIAMLERPESREERARLTAEISRAWQDIQKRPKRKFLNARTQEYKYAAYMDAWRAKVERIGNLNYPEQAKKRRITGSLVLDVALNPDGVVRNVVVRRSSGHKLLDDAAVRIVELAAPFAPFPAEIRRETDILHITRTWKFNESLTSSE